MTGRHCSTARRLIVASLGMLMAGCGTVNGPTLVMNPAGPVNNDATAGPALTFKTLEAQARAATGDTHAPSLLMLLSGMTLARANCGEYFRSAGVDQRRTIVARQALNAVGALATTLMLIEDVDPDSITLVQLGQSSANTGLDIWTRNYLFDADNIAAVEDLVRKAEDAYAAEARLRTSLDYNKVSDLILDYQALCQPRRISALVVEAIRAGKLEAASTTTGQTSQEAILDRKGRRDLADIFDVPGELSASQTGALYWLLMSSSTPETRKGQITTLLGPLAATVLENGEIKSTWSRRGDVRNALMLLNADTQAGFATTATNTQKSEEAKPAAPAGPTPPPPPGGGVPVAPPPPPPPLPLANFVMSPVVVGSQGAIVVRVE